MTYFIVQFEWHVDEGAEWIYLHSLSRVAIDLISTENWMCILSNDVEDRKLDMKRLLFCCSEWDFVISFTRGDSYLLSNQAFWIWKFRLGGGDNWVCDKTAIKKKSCVPSNCEFHKQTFLMFEVRLFPCIITLVSIAVYPHLFFFFFFTQSPCHPPLCFNVFTCQLHLRALTRPLKQLDIPSPHFIFIPSFCAFPIVCCLQDLTDSTKRFGHHPKMISSRAAYRPWHWLQKLV